MCPIANISYMFRSYELFEPDPGRLVRSRDVPLIGVLLTSRFQSLALWVIFEEPPQPKWGGGASPPPNPIKFWGGRPPTPPEFWLGGGAEEIVEGASPPQFPLFSPPQPNF